MWTRKRQEAAFLCVCADQFSSVVSCPQGTSESDKEEGCELSGHLQLGLKLELEVGRGGLAEGGGRPATV